MVEPSDPSGTDAQDVGASTTAGTRSRSFSAVTVAVVVGALAVGLLGGAAIGVKVEQNRTKHDIKRIRERAAARAKESEGSAVRVIGKVSAASETKATIGQNGGGKSFAIDQATVVERAVPASPSDITKGAHVVWTNVPGSKTKAAEVVVLAPSATLGVVVTDASPTSMTYSASKNGNVVVTTTGAKVYRVLAAQPGDIKAGEPVVARIVTVKGKPARASEVILLVPQSAFTSAKS